MQSLTRELLERDEALAALSQARDAAADGRGGAVLVTGEPGIGKTALVRRFVAGLPADARVLAGSCDDLAIPRPLGPIRDLAGTVSAPLERALATDAALHEIQSLVGDELALAPVPTVLVLEDVHWADDATLDLITVLGRRIGTLPALLVLTFRGGEVPPGHRLRAAVAAVRAESTVFLELAPLSARAVATLAGDAAESVYAVTRGNPFYVTELIAAGQSDELPPTIANAVLGRASRLDDESRRLVELVSVVPGRVSTSVLDAVMPGWAVAAEEPERRELLEVDPRYVRFRHELARHAIRASVPAAAARRLHGEIVEALLAAGADPADIVHHAEAAGAIEVVAAHALVAARRASALESHREAYSHYRRAADFAGDLAPAERARLYEELAIAAYGVGRIEDAFDPIGRAIAIDDELGDHAGVGRCTRLKSRFHWFAGDGEAARAAAVEAIAILEPLGESPELARAYSGFSQLSSLAQDLEPAVAWATRALDLALRLGDERTRAHALVNLGMVKAQLAPDDPAALLEAHAVADAAAEREEAVRALGNLGFTLLYWARPAPAAVYLQQALDYAREHEVHHLAAYIGTSLAWVRLRAGAWDEAERMTRNEIERGITVPQLLAKTVLTELAVRRGDPDAAERLADLSAQADRAGDLQRITPVLELEVERGLLEGTPMPVDRIDRLVDAYRPRGGLMGWGFARVAAWAAVAGVELERDEPIPPPFGPMIGRDWRAAAEAFGELGWPYDAALMLSLLDDEASLAAALETARALGAEPLVRRVAARMRELGLGVPRGPRQATRENPAGLTPRQLEVLALVVGGLTNAEIANRLFVSPRTAEHHVAAVLAKIGAATRRDAARRAAELGLS
jgi:DNA-binding CsgD family transcriptional regulator/tetratricopeptide (TPR) repeat protein